MKTFKIENEIVEDYTILEFPSGIKQILINTREKGVNFHVINDYTIDFYDEKNEYTLKIDEQMLNIDDQSYMKTEMQNKDQVSIFYIPFSLLKREKKVDYTNPVMFILKTIEKRVVDVQVATNEEEVNILEKAGYVLDIHNEARNLEA